MKNKKGMSGIIVTIILVLLALVAVGVVWGIVNNFISGSSEDIASSQKCLDAQFSIEKANCVSGVCNVTFRRTMGSEEIGGVKLIFTDEAGENNYQHSVSGNMNAMSLKTESSVDTNLDSISKVELAVYFLNENNEENLCPNLFSKII